MERILGVLDRQLDALETRLGSVIASEDPLVQQVFEPIRQSSGKRIRPVLVFLAAACFSDELEPALTVATSAELVHTATLVHDDVVDNAELRRGRPTIHSRFGNKIAVLGGDVLFARSFNMLVHIGDTRFLRRVLLMISGMGEGEIMQLLHAYNVGVTEEQYIERVKRKTALFFEACCELGALAGGATEQQTTALARFGLNVGIAFQIYDDLLDFTGDEARVGKPVCSDLREGNLTMPVLHCIRHSSQAPSIVEAIGRRALDAERIDAVRAAVREAGSLEYAAATARAFVERGLAALREIPPSTARDDLEELAHYVIQRSY